MHNNTVPRVKKMRRATEFAVFEKGEEKKGEVRFLFLPDSLSFAEKC